MVGPSADVLQIDGTGSSYVTPFYTVTPKQGIENILGTDKVLYAKGCNITGSNAADFATALQYASDADVVIYIGGLDQTQEGEGFDRVDGSIELPQIQKNFINNLAIVNSNLIVVLFSGGICTAHPFIDKVKGLLYAFYPGQEGGNALAKILFGEYNPAGRLPVTMPVSDSQLPDRNFNFDDDLGGGYRWFDDQGLKPEFAFGFGLSYTTFEYSNLVITPTQTTIGKTVEVSCDIKNTGSVEGEEVAQLYLSADNHTIVFPKKHLKGFKRISLQPGETKTVTFDLTANELYYFDETADVYKIDPGDYIVKVGGSSDKLPLEGSFSLTDDQLKPDLLISNVKMVPPFPQVGDTVTFVATILNHGTGASPDGIIHEVDFKVNGDLISKSTNFNNSIPAGGMALVCGNTAVNGKNYWVAENSGTFNIEADVNPNNTITEIYSTNNSKTSDVKVAGASLENLALNKTVQVSSIEKAGVEGNYAVDGNMNTRWSSQFSDPQYITIDLGSVQAFNKINLFWETAYGKEYKVYVSDDNSNWNEIYHQANGVGGSESIIHQSTGRYVKIYGIQRGTEWGYSLWEVQVFNDPEITSIKEKNKIENSPKGFILYNNYPNPFNPSTVISYQLPIISNVSLKVFDILGNEVSTLINQQQQPGEYEVSFDAGKLGLSSGVYFYKLSAGDFIQVKSMVLLK